ncbi:hypothetical protein [Natrialba sp. PRR66]|uniref:hypothetical protein n=1 Tax=Natrialba sp. PRR66 TaxID=3098146 RepID=UPI002B1E7BFC|nr:hypothetical protein [Natrialba sp. PRR66]
MFRTECGRVCASAFGELAHRARSGRFASVGVVGAVRETIIVAIATAAAGVGLLAAKAVGAEVSITAMVVINDR